MVSSKVEGGLIYNVKLSSVGPGRFTGQDIVHEPNGMDLAMKLHYLRGIYYFPSQAFEGLTFRKIKEPLFTWFNHFYMTCGRFRRSEESGGRPVIKCNDCGARFVEAQSDKTLDEWLEMMKDASNLERLLVSDKIIGPELAFSPLVFIQYTKFKCGGMAVGLSWAHVLGDAFSAAEFMNVLGKLLAGNEPARPLNTARSLSRIQNPDSPRKVVVEDPLSVKRVGPVEDTWITVNNRKMETFSFHVTPTQLSHIESKIWDKYDSPIAPFESICAVIWKCMAKIRHGNEPKVVTICQKGSRNKGDGILSNSQILSIVKADFAISKANHDELAAMIKNQAIDERKKIEEAMECYQGLADFVVYGANLTFVNFQEANFYGFEYNGQKPVYVSYVIDGVGDEGAVLVLPGTKNGAKDGRYGKIVNLILPENEIVELKSELKREWSIA
ncbi:hypothetical protein ACH5RR_032655 [Cinchona calisaya]|uniref:Protein ECERIFERUM 26-like n=1 Tax=Cinchona calisaya TaxID=153742 RepID=A0ABD2YP00_9GENT